MLVMDNITKSSCLNNKLLQLQQRRQQIALHRHAKNWDEEDEYSLVCRSVPTNQIFLLKYLNKNKYLPLLAFYKNH